MKKFFEYAKHFIAPVIVAIVAIVFATDYQSFTSIVKTINVEVKADDSTSGTINTEVAEVDEEDTEEDKISEEEAEAMDKTSGSVAGVSAEGLSDGSYSGSGYGWANSSLAYKAGQGTSGPSVSVTVTVKNGKITAISASSSDTSAYFSRAKAIIPTIISKQSTSVDVVSGATYSSNGLKQAINNAISKAAGKEEKVTKPKEEVTTSSKKDSNKHKLELVQEDTEDEVNADEEIDDGASIYASGSYTCKGKGLNGDIVLKVTFKEDKITNIGIVSYEDDDEWFEEAWALKDQIIETQSADVDVVSGATYSSNGIKTAVTDAMQQAKDKMAEKKANQALSTNNANSEDESLSAKTSVSTNEAVSANGIVGGIMLWVMHIL